MIYKESKLNVVDNSGVISVKCIRILNSKSKIAKVGNLILTRIYIKNIDCLLKQKTLYYGLIIMIKQNVIRKDGIVIKCNNNCILLFSNLYKFLGSRIFSAIMKEIFFFSTGNKKEKQKYFKILSLCDSII